MTDINFDSQFSHQYYLQGEIPSRLSPKAHSRFGIPHGYNSKKFSVVLLTSQKASILRTAPIRSGLEVSKMSITGNHLKLFACEMS